METSGWFGVRCDFKMVMDEGRLVYEERVTVWRAVDAEEAIRLAEAEALEYANDIDADYLGLAQAYTMADDLAAGARPGPRCSRLCAAAIFAHPDTWARTSTPVPNARPSTTLVPECDRTNRSCRASLAVRRGLRHERSRDAERPAA